MNITRWLENRPQRNRQRGYTLLEMTLVLAVIAMIATFAIKLYRDSTQSNRVNKASLQMQHILEAALAYHADHGYWPPANPYDDSTDQCKVDATQTTYNPLMNYIPNKTNLSNFGNYYCWSGGIDPDNTHIPPEPNDDRFWVALKLPEDYNNIAAQIAARLPNAVATTVQPEEDVDAGPVPVNNCEGSDDACYIRAEVPKTAQSQTQGNEQVKAVGYCMPSDPRKSGSSEADPSTPCSGNVCLLKKVNSSAGDTIYCQQRARPSLDTPGQMTNHPDADMRLTYDIHFSCSGELVPKLYVTPNFVTYPRYYQSDYAYIGSNYADFPAYQIQTQRNGQTSQAPYDSFTADADCQNNGGDCIARINANYYAHTGSADAYPIDGLPLSYTGSGAGSYPKDYKPEIPGAVGLTYIAICAPPNTGG